MNFMPDSFKNITDCADDFFDYSFTLVFRIRTRTAVTTDIVAYDFIAVKVFFNAVNS